MSPFGCRAATIQPPIKIAGKMHDAQDLRFAFLNCLIWRWNKLSLGLTLPEQTLLLARVLRLYRKLDPDNPLRVIARKALIAARERQTKRSRFALRCLKLARSGQMEALGAEAMRADFKMFDDMRPQRMHDLSPLERTIFAEVCGYSCQCPEAIAQLSRHCLSDR